MTIVNAFYRAHMLDEMDLNRRALSFLSGMRQLMRFIAADPIERRVRCAAYRSDDLMRWLEVWNLFNGKLRPPRAAHCELGVAGSEP